jgi:hypothetical protein
MFFLLNIFENSMITALKQYTTVKKGGLIELYVSDLSEGTEIEIAAVLSDVNAERDDTTYLLSNPATRERILRSLENIEQGQNLMEIEIGEED